jgi:hypothetical protein
MAALEGTAVEARDRPAAILAAEARCLACTLDSYGVLTRWQLAELSGSRSWHDGGFSIALELAIKRGMIRDLGLGFYAPSRPWSAKPHARITEAPNTTSRGRRFRLSVRRVDQAK